jgi:hypothetical protein
MNLHWGAEEEVSNSTRDCSQFGTKRMLQKDHGFTEFILPPPHPNVPFPTINLKLVGHVILFNLYDLTAQNHIL